MSSTEDRFLLLIADSSKYGMIAITAFDNPPYGTRLMFSFMQAEVSLLDYSLQPYRYQLFFHELAEYDSS
jgi:hypothetical protein